MYGHLRLAIAVQGATEQGSYPLGRWAQIAASTDQYFAQYDQSERLMWFENALGQVLSILKENNAKATAIMTGHDSSAEDWQFALIMEQSGLMSIYGGYDEQGQPKGYQSIHNTLLAQAKEQEFAMPGVGLGAAGGCILLGVFLGPETWPAAAWCAGAAVVGAIQYAALAHLAGIAQTLAYVGIEHSLLPPSEAIRLRSNARLTAIATVADVLFSAVGVVQSMPELIRFGQRIGVLDESIDAERVLDAIYTRIRSFFGFYRAETVYALEKREYLFAKLEALNETDFQILHQFKDTTLHANSSYGFSRSEVFHHLASRGEPQELLLEAVEQFGVPRMGFVATDYRFAENGDAVYQSGGGYYMMTEYHVQDGTVEVSKIGEGTIYAYDYPSTLPSAVEKGFVAPHKVVTTAGSRGALTYDAFLDRSATVFQEELLHYLDFHLPGGNSNLMIQGINESVKTPLIHGDAITFLEELAQQRGIPIDDLYTDAIHFFTEVRGDRLFFEGGQTVVSNDWIVQRLSLVRVQNRWKEESFTMKYLDVFVSLLDEADPVAAFNRLLPPELWQDISDPRFYYLN
ncbi:MAG: hypothetical protein IPJ88_06460 [Myxococcales bacterium]|nr:MAG: hypothetical protein IPJ88_06460 [Myxococcales bacterium]